MNKKLILVCFVMLSFGFVKEQKESVVFKSGSDGYSSFRIPALITLPDGDLLAFSEGRKHNAGDFGDIDIVLKRSSDGGKTWGDLSIVVDNDSLQAGNPAPVVDLTDPQYPNGRIFLFYNTGNTTEGAVRNGKGLREVWFVTSSDNGKTWSAAQNITTSVHKPKQSNINPNYNFPEDWRSYANTPGHAMQYEWGKYKGRIYVAANHSEGKPLPHFKDYKAHGYYTDDHGATFHLSDDVPFEGGNESMAAQLTGDNLMLNIRNQQGNVKSRIIALSSNGGVQWDTTYYDVQLPDPICQGSILSFKNKKGKTTLVVCNNADTTSRNRLTLRISKDDGKTWYYNHVIVEGLTEKTSKDISAYSDISLVRPHMVGVLYEKNNYKEIVFVDIKIK